MQSVIDFLINNAGVIGTIGGFVLNYVLKKIDPKRRDIIGIALITTGKVISWAGYQFDSKPDNDDDIKIVQVLKRFKNKVLQNENSSK